MSKKLETTIDIDTGTITKERHFKNFDLHRDPAEGPAVIHRSKETGAIYNEEYFVDGKRHREDGPASVYRYKDGSIECEDWYLRGKLHRDPKQGPAKIYRTYAGVIEEEFYYVHGKLYRNPADGPQQIFRYEDGSIEEEVFAKRKPGRPTSTGHSSAPGAGTPKRRFG